MPDEIKASPEYQRAFLNSNISSLGDEDLSTRHLMESSWQRNFPAVLPQPIVVNAPDKPPPFTWKTRADGSLHLEEVPDIGYLVPFKDALAQLLSIKCVFESVKNSFLKNEAPLPPASERVYSDVWDGKAMRNNPVFIKTKGAVLAVQLYFDEIEPANALGSNKGVYKMGCFYWVLLNLPPEFRSNLRSIQLLGIINADLLKLHGPSKFLQPFLDDMLAFQNGVELIVRGETILWHAVLINWVGDMLGSNFMAGFKETGSAYSPCRICEIKRNDLESINHACFCVLRNKFTYNLQVAALADVSLSKAERTALSREYGINRPCIMSILPYYDATQDLPHDIMHVVDEGVENLELSFLLRKLIQDYGLNLEEVNFLLSRMKSQREFTLPPPIRLDEVMTPGKKLSFSASEMASLSSVMPLILGEWYSAHENKYYANYLLLLKISASLRCYSFTESDLTSLENDVMHHNIAFSSLYPQLDADRPAVTPKVHAYIHFAEQIRLFGAARYFCCYRFESKNAMMKKIFRRVCNFINVAFTMASHHQKLMALDVVIDGETDFFGIDSIALKINSVRTSMPLMGSPWETLLIASHLFVNNEHSIVTPAGSFYISGRLCRVHSVFLKCMPLSDDSLPKFWRVSDVLRIDEHVMILEDLLTCYFDLDRFSFVTRPSNNFHAVHSHRLSFRVPLQSFDIDGNIRIIPNYYHVL